MTLGLESVSKLQKGILRNSGPHVCSAELQQLLGRDFLLFCGSKGAALTRKSPMPKVGSGCALPKNELAPSHSGEFQLGTPEQSIYASVCIV